MGSLIIKFFSQKIIMGIAMKLIKHLAGKSTNKLDNEIVKIIEKEHKRLYENK